MRSAKHSKTRYCTPPRSATSTAGSIRSPEKPAPAPILIVLTTRSSATGLCICHDRSARENTGRECECRHYERGPERPRENEALVVP